MLNKSRLQKAGSSIIIFALMLMMFQACDSSTSPQGGEPEIEEPPPPESELCEDTYPCQDISLLAHLNPQELLGERLNDIWGWTDPQTDKEYALVGLTDRLTFVDISVPSEPIVVGTLPESIDGSGPDAMPFHDDEEGGGEEGKSAWRDVKVYQNHAYVVSDGQPHGLQVFDLTRLRNVSNTPQTFTEDKHYTEFGNAHNIAINEASGFAYVLGSSRAGGGLYIMDLSSPKDPVLAGTHTDTTVGLTSPGYVHDTQCVMYSGPDTEYTGQEICFNSSESHLVIANVTDKEATSTIAKVTNESNEYFHQGWLTEDQRYFLLDDELDEGRTTNVTTTYIWDVQDLDNPKMIGTFESGTSKDHNQYVKRNYSYQANYTGGLRIMDLSNISSGELQEVAYFDTHPSTDAPQFDGAWSVYPYFESGVVAVSDVTNGLFLLSPEI